MHPTSRALNVLTIGILLTLTLSAVLDKTSWADGMPTTPSKKLLQGGVETKETDKAPDWASIKTVETEPYRKNPPSKAILSSSTAQRLTTPDNPALNTPEAPISKTLQNLFKNPVPPPLFENGQTPRLAFYYKPGAHVSVLEGNSWPEAWANEHYEEPFSVWRAQGGPSPGIFRSKLFVNKLLQEPLWMQIQLTLGQLKSLPGVGLTDYEALARVQKQIRLPATRIAIPAQPASSNSQSATWFLLGLPPIELQSLSAQYPGYWPCRILVRVWGKTQVVQQATLILIPDHIANF